MNPDTQPPIRRRLDPRPLAQIGHCRLEVLRRLAGRPIVGHADLDREEVIELCRLAAHLESTEVASHHPLDGLVVITAFFEPSTRTRLSFESAALRLDGKILSVPDGKVTGIAKGESLADIGEMFNSYGDLLVMRHPVTEATEEIVEHLAIPMINAGNGSGEHPTQALVDWYTLLKWRPELASPTPSEDARIDLAVLGTPGSMRAVKSFTFAALHFRAAIRSLTVVSEMADPFGPELAAAVEASGIDVRVVNDLDPPLQDFDVIYQNAIALLGDAYKELNDGCRLSADREFKPGAVILHPLARRDELDTSLDRSEHNLYFAQAAGAVFVRQALMVSVLDRLGRLPDSFSERPR